MRNFKVTVDGQVYNVTVEETFAAPAVNAAPAPVQVAAPSAPAPAAPAPAAPAPVAAAAPAAAPVADVAGGTEVISPMPGMIVALKFENGAEVKEGDVILVLEAMKMENDISAPTGGKVFYKAAKGGNIASGDVIAVIK